MNSEKLKKLLLSPDDLLELIDKVGLSMDQDSSGIYRHDLSEISVQDSFLKRYKTTVSGEEEALYFLPADFFMKTVKMTEESLHMTLFQ